MDGMKYYKNGVGAVFAYASDGSQDTVIAADMVRMSQLEVAAFLYPSPSARDVALANIAKLEAMVTPSMLLGAALGDVVVLAELKRLEGDIAAINALGVL